MKKKDDLNFKTTAEIKVNERIVDQVIGQERAVDIIKKAAQQKRHVLLIGEPGTGKSLIGQALAELLPTEKLTDVLCTQNPKDENNPLIHTVPAGQGRKIVDQGKLNALAIMQGGNNWMYIIGIFVVIYIATTVFDWIAGKEKEVILQATDRIVGSLFIIVMIMGAIIFYALYKLKAGKPKIIGPKLIIDNSERKTAPFIDATGLHEGALLGDVLHDPFMTGGLGTPAHERVVCGAIQKANKGVLFIDEIATLKPEMQVEILTAMQEKKYPITGRSERSAGAMVTTKPIPTDFVLVAAGNLETIKNMHIALRSRIRGAGYEVYMNNKMDDTPENVQKIIMFVAQEIKKDGRIPAFSRDAVMEIIKEARRRAGSKGYLTLKLRDLGGLIRAAGDLAIEDKAKVVSAKHVLDAKTFAATLERQITEKYTKEKKEYQIIQNSGSKVGRVNGLAVLGDEHGSGMVLPIEATVVPTMEKARGQVIATGRLGEIAKEAISNVSAIFKKYAAKDLSNYDVHIQFLQSYEGLEGDSASIAVAAAVISAMTGIPVKQNVSMTGSLSVLGEVLPIGAVNTKIEAAAEAGMEQILIPKTNEKDVLVDEAVRKKIKVIPVEHIWEVLDCALAAKGSKKKVVRALKRG